MTQIFIQLTQTVTGAVIAIIGLLLVAAIIGYFTAWFYAKSVYMPVIKGLESDKEGLKREVSGLQNDVTKLNTRIEKLNERIATLEKEIIARNKEIKDLTGPKS